MSRGRPQFQPTNEQREQCAILAAGRMSEENIAAALGVSRPTLRKHFAHELTTGAAQRNAAVLLALYETAVAGNVAAARTWLAARQGDEQGAALGRKAQREAASAEAPPGAWAALIRH